MKKYLLSMVMAVAVAAMAVPAFATNGTNIIGVGTISRSMGGVGVAAPQDAITAVFGNPAAMCYIPCESSEVDFAATVFDPKIEARVRTPFTYGGLSATSLGAPYAFPAIGIYTPINEKLRFGLAAYGVSGLGVDYKETDLKSLGEAINGNFGTNLKTDIKTDLQVMKFSPNIAYMITPDLSVGAAFQCNWAQLDLGDGSSHNFGFGAQVGVNYRIGPAKLGVSYQTAQTHTFKRIYNFNSPDMEVFGLTKTDDERDTLKLQQPQQVVVGVAYDIIPDMAMLEVNGKWYNWSDAEGYKDFDWKDQWIVAAGAQVKPLDWLAVRVGYNYGNNPVKEHSGWNPFAHRSVQGTPVNTFMYEYLRVIGFPAIVEQHVTGGIGINLTKKVSVNLGYMHAFASTTSETSRYFSAGVEGPSGHMKLQSKLSEDSYEFGINMIF